MEKPLAVIVCGATATGKTRLAVDLARYFDGEIISADSMQIYKTMNIATAKPTEEEKCGVPHHLMDFLSPTEAFSVADYVKLAKEKLAEITARDKLPVIAGGTGLYISSLVDNVAFDETMADYAYREHLRQYAIENGNSALRHLLEKADPEAAAKLHENNVKRVIRALEVYKTSGRKISELQAESKKTASDYNYVMLGIDFADREDLYERINRRVDLMLETGLAEEAREFFSHGDCPTAVQAIGYKELKPYIDGEEGLEICTERLKRETRNYAKRQLTWFKKDTRINWLIIEKSSDNADKSSFYDNEYDKILSMAKKIVKSSSIYMKNML